MAIATSQYVKEWLADQNVLCYRFNDLNTATVDDWANDLTVELTTWPAGKPWRLILDIRLRGNVVNTYALRRAREISRLRPDLPGRLALLVSSKLAANVISMAIRTANNNFRKRQVFVSEVLAVHWLLEEKAR